MDTFVQRFCSESLCVAWGQTTNLSWGWLLRGMLWKVGLKEQRERKNKSKVTQEPFERKVK